VPVSFRDARARRRRLRDEGLPSPHYPDRRSAPSRSSPPPRPGRHAHRGARTSRSRKDAFLLLQAALDQRSRAHVVRCFHAVFVAPRAFTQGALRDYTIRGYRLPAPRGWCIQRAGAHPSKAHRACGSKFPRSFDDGDGDGESYSSPSSGGVSSPRSPAGSGGGASDDWDRRAAGYHQAGPNSASRRWAAGQLGTLDGYEPDGGDGNCSGSGPETPTPRCRTTPGVFQEREGGRAPPVTRPPGKTMRRTNGSGGSVGSAPGRRPPPRPNSRAARAAAYDGSDSST